MAAYTVIFFVNELEMICLHTSMDIVATEFIIIIIMSCW